MFSFRDFKMLLLRLKNERRRVRMCAFVDTCSCACEITYIYKIFTLEFSGEAKSELHCSAMQELCALEQLFIWTILIKF